MNDCPWCGSFGEEVFNEFRCANPLCRNFPRPRARDPEPEPPDEDTKEMEVVDLPPSGPIYRPGAAGGIFDDLWDPAHHVIPDVDPRTIPPGATVVIRPDLVSWLDSPEAAEAVKRVVSQNRRRTP